MKDIILGIITSYYTWIAIELIVIGILVFFIVKYSRMKKEKKREIERRTESQRYQELDEMLVNRKRSRR